MTSLNNEVKQTCELQSGNQKNSNINFIFIFSFLYMNSYILCYINLNLAIEFGELMKKCINYYGTKKEETRKHVQDIFYATDVGIY